MNRITVWAALGMLVAVGAGCATGPSYIQEPISDDLVWVGTGYATAADLDAAAQQLLAKMRAHEAFKAGYEEIKTKAGGVPVLAVADIASPARLPFSSKARLVLLKEKLVTSAFESGLFRVYDGEEGLEKADLVLQGSLTAVREATGCNVYHLQLQLKVRSTNLIVWTGAESFVKLR